MSKRLQVVLTDEEYEQVRAKAGLVPMSAWARAVLLSDKIVTDAQWAEVPDAIPKTEKPKSKKSGLAEAVASRTHHPAGCGCFQCIQAERFFKQQRKEE